MEEGNFDGPLTAAACLPLRDLVRSPGAVMNAVERDGKIIAISRYGRLAALLVPVPERLVLEIEDGTPLETAREVAAHVPDLGTLAAQFLIDAASTPTGYWYPPDSAHRDQTAGTLSRAFEELYSNALAEPVSGTKLKITTKGRSVARALARRGSKGYAELNDGE